MHLWLASIPPLLLGVTIVAEYKPAQKRKNIFAEIFGGVLVCMSISLFFLYGSRVFWKRGYDREYTNMTAEPVAVKLRVLTANGRHCVFCFPHHVGDDGDRICLFIGMCGCITKLLVLCVTQVLQAYTYVFADSKTEMGAIVIPFRCFLWMLPLVPAADPYLPECDCQNETSISIVITEEFCPLHSQYCGVSLSITCGNRCHDDVT